MLEVPEVLEVPGVLKVPGMLGVLGVLPLGYRPASVPAATVPTRTGCPTPTP